MAVRTTIRLGCAGWSIPRAYAAAFPGPGSHLERYARVLPAVEINSSFYRPHRRQTYERWARSAPEAFRFAVKVPREITHRRRLEDAAEAITAFLGETDGLGPKRGPVLVQLPPSLRFAPSRAQAFLGALRERHDGPVALEPRHASWFAADVESLLALYRVARVAADPAPAPGADEPGGWPGLVYLRLHGSPVRFVSAYPEAFLSGQAARLRALPRGTEAWCVFNNTASGAAAGDALALLRVLTELGDAAPRLQGTRIAPRPRRH